MYYFLAVQGNGGLQPTGNRILSCRRLLFVCLFTAITCVYVRRCVFAVTGISILLSSVVSHKCNIGHWHPNWLQYTNTKSSPNDLTVRPWRLWFPRNAMRQLPTFCQLQGGNCGNTLPCVCDMTMMPRPSSDNSIGRHKHPRLLLAA